MIRANWVLDTLLTYNCQQRSGEASPPPSGPSWMDGDGTFLECRVFLAGPPHHFSQHGMVDTLDGVGDSTCPAVQTAELLTSSLLACVAASRVERLVALDRRSWDETQSCSYDGRSVEIAETHSHPS